ncbi:uncharacterized mitochondrial protein AtMg00810-like [Nicotiana tomentosiformis]|uniref:uncharacterized mitochondrial protein AtMg00810-like n=1 Tax=Nicotiana tomentosiformis TaxID=4098 RepID=UPI00388C87A1
MTILYFFKRTSASSVFLAVYVDDIILTGDDMAEITALKSFLDAEFKIKDLGLLNYFLGIELHSKAGDILPRPDTYRGLIGKLNFLTHTRPDLCFAMQYLSQFLKAPRVPHMAVALHVLRYLKGTPDLGILLNKSSDFSLYGYCDSDWATCPETRKSVTGFCVTFGSSLIS